MDDDCKYSHNDTKLLQISSIVLGYYVTSGMLDYLTICISEYLNDFRKLYANTANQDDETEMNANVENDAAANDAIEDDVMEVDRVVADILADRAVEEGAVGHDEEEIEGESKNLIPKQHFMTHNPRLIENFGSLVQFWCMRMESKHSPFKRRTQFMHNYKNLPLRLANWHQLYQTWQLMFSLTKETEIGPLKPVITEILPFNHLFREHQIVFKTLWLGYNGTKYVARKCYIPIVYDTVTCLPRFTQLHSII